MHAEETCAENLYNKLAQVSCITHLLMKVHESSCTNWRGIQLHPIRYKKNLHQKKLAQVTKSMSDTGFLDMFLKRVSAELATNFCKCSANTTIALQVIIDNLTS